MALYLARPRHYLFGKEWEDAMLDQTTRRGKIIETALKLAAERGWNALTLDEIAAAAGYNLAEFRQEFSAKAQILAAFTRALDDAVLAKIDRPEPGAAARDRLFDVLMTRFEVMTPYKAALRRILGDLRYRPGESLAQFGAAGRSIYWMLEAAGIDAEGPRGALRIPGMMGIYARVFDIWLEDDDPGMARTMAALDSRLRRGEQVVQRVDDMLAAAGQMFATLKGRRRKAPAEPAHDMPVAVPPVTPPPGAPPAGPAGTESGPLPAV
jgi:ubiquinone biosynthesis protein COQ9